MRNFFKKKFYIIFFCLSASKKYYIFFTIDKIVQKFMVFFEMTYGINFILNAIENKYNFQIVLRFILMLMLLIFITTSLSSLINNVFLPKIKPLLTNKIRTNLYKKSMDLDIECYDDSDFYNSFVLTVEEVDSFIEIVTSFLGILVDGVTSLILYGLFFMKKDIISMLFVVVNFLLTFISSKKINELLFNIKTEEKILRRKNNYINRVYYLKEYTKEIRLKSNANNLMQMRFKKNNNDLINLYKKYSKRLFCLKFIRGFISDTFLSKILYISYLVFSTLILKTISVGDMIVLYSSSTNLKKGLQKITDIVPAYVDVVLYSQRLFSFMNYKNKISSGDLKFPQKIKKLEFKNVFFSYPNTDKNILNNLSFVVYGESNVGIVGLNGSGKTTLIKLLMRLYEPTSGEILINGININKFELHSYRQAITTIFQDYNIYALKLKENIIMDSFDKCIEDDAKESLKKAGFSKTNLLTKGLNTIIRKEFDEDAVELSGGEQQKIAISRSFYKESRILIMDEPTSALDPISEQNICKELYNRKSKNIVIFISHRLSAIINSDVILVLNDGCLKESGTHQQLMNKEGLYFKMFMQQTQSYL